MKLSEMRELVNKCEGFNPSIHDLVRCFSVGGKEFKKLLKIAETAKTVDLELYCSRPVEDTDCVCGPCRVRKALEDLENEA